MAKIVHLKAGEKPPAGRRFLLVQWKPGEGAVTENQSEGLTQKVPQHLWDSSVSDMTARADGMGFDTIYIQGKPENA
jgi:hypothetical protein